MVMLRLLLLLLRLLLLLLLLLPLLLLLLLLFLKEFVVASFGVKSKLTPSFFSNPLPPSPPPKKNKPSFWTHPPHSHSPAPLTHPPTPLTQCLLPPAKGTPF
jgi:hypothetical protein